jgi:competence protein ComEA
LAPGATAAGGPIVVHVAGRVQRAGLVTLPAGARVGEAVTAAGGATKGADLSAINLARPLADGEQVLVPAKGEVVPVPAPGPAGGGGSGPRAQAAAIVDLNAATLQDFEQLPGVGPVLAQRIFDWCTEHGRFSSVDELSEVSGIGDAKLEQIRPKARV